MSIYFTHQYYQYIYINKSSVAGVALDLFQARWDCYSEFLSNDYIHAKMCQDDSSLHMHARKNMLSSTNLLQSMALNPQKCKLPKLQQKGQKLR